MPTLIVPEEKPIACTLGVNDSKERFALIAELNRDALQSYERRGLVLELRYGLQALDGLRELVRQEQECCAFMTFGLNVGQTDVTLTITASEHAREAADLLFEQFVASTETGAACGCGPTSGKSPGRKSGVVGKAAGSVALVSAAGAVVACAVCVIPFALPAVLLAGAGGVLASLNSAHVWITGIAIAVLATAWIWVWRQSAQARMRPASSTLMMMSIATIFVAVALLWPEIEPEILRLVGA